MEVLEQGELPKKRLQNCRPYNNSKLCVLYEVLSRTPLSLYKKSGHKRPDRGCAGYPGRKSGRPAKIGTGGNPTRSREGHRTPKPPLGPATTRLGVICRPPHVLHLHTKLQSVAIS